MFRSHRVLSAWTGRIHGFPTQRSIMSRLYHTKCVDLFTRAEAVLRRCVVVSGEADERREPAGPGDDEAAAEHHSDQRTDRHRARTPVHRPGAPAHVARQHRAFRADVRQHYRARRRLALDA
eukprot:6176889-Pleurochrysis_carterae.AAC.1